jgi:hypothetical protein
MTDGNPPPERERQNLDSTRNSSDDQSAETIERETWLLLNQTEPNAERRATLWLVGRGWVQSQYDEHDPAGARALQKWMRAMLNHPQPG